MGRALRIEFAGAFYHVTSRGNERKAIYRDDADRHRFLAFVADVVDRFQLLLHAYVLMDNHYHLLIETLEPNLARAMRALNGDHAKRFNRAHRRVGHLFGRRYKAILVERDSYLVELSRYIHLNPVRAGLVERVDRYRWSSAQAYMGRRLAPPFLTVADVLGHFGHSVRHAQRRYSDFLGEGERRPPSSPIERVIAGTLLGDPEWVQQMRTRIDASLHRKRIDDDAGEMPAVRKLRTRPTVDAVIDSVGDVMGVDRRAITDYHSRSRARAVAMHLSYNLTGLKQKVIGEAFGVGAFAVSKAAAMVEKQLPKDRRLQCVVNQLRKALSRPP